VIWRGFIFNVPLGTFGQADLVGLPIAHDGKVIGEIKKVVTDVDHNCQRVYASLHEGASLPENLGQVLEVSIGCRP
jgi:hypothetical protein